MPWWAWLLVGFGVAVVVLIVWGVLSSYHVQAAPQKTNVENLALILTATPNLRARFFADPTKAIGKGLPARKYWDYQLTTNPWKFVGRWRELRRTRAVLAQDVVLSIAGQISEQQLLSTINTDAVFEEFFAPSCAFHNEAFIPFSC
jgi:hypothetical protein